MSGLAEDTESIGSYDTPTSATISELLVKGNVHVAISAEQMRRDLAKAQAAMSLFIQARFEAADALLREDPGLPSSLYLNLGVAFISFVRAIFTYDTEDVLRAEADMQRAHFMAVKLGKELAGPNLAARLYSAFSRRDTGLPRDELTGAELALEDVSFILRHAELVEAESSLMGSVIRIFGEPDGMNIRVLLREVWNVRSGYNYYHGEAHRARTPSRHPEDAEFEAGVSLGNGIINIAFAMMPPSIFKIFSYIGYTGDAALGMQQLDLSAASGGVRSHLAQIIELVYYTVITGSFSSNKEEGAFGFAGRQQAALQILAPLRQQYPASPIFLFFEGRAHFLAHDVPAAITSYAQAIEHSAGSWPALKLAIYWDLILGHMRQLEWTRCLEYAAVLATESKWSLLFCTYMEVVFREACARECPAEAETIRAPVAALLERIPTLERRIAGRAFPMERYAVVRAQMVLAGGCRLFYAEYELMALWDSFSYMNAPTLAKAEATMAAALAAPDLGWQPMALLTITLASIRRIQKQLEGPAGSLALLQAVLDTHEGRTPTCWAHLLPLAHVEMAASLLALGRPADARPHYKTASRWKEKYYLDRTIQVRCSKLAPLLGAMPA